MEQDLFNFEHHVLSPPTVETPHVFSVTDLTAAIRNQLEGNFTDVWVSGEVTNFRNRTSRHWYFSLKDAESQVAAIIFGAAHRPPPFELTDGLQVICHGRLSVYPPRGSYSLVIDQIEPKGIGALQLAFEQLKKKLAAEGLFAPERKRSLPFLPRKIGIVTSPTGAAIRDIIQIALRRFPGISLLVAPVKVQGDGAASEIAAAIVELNQRNDIDVLIVGRGGGSLEDLWAFNEEVVARAIYHSRIPVVSAVGHEIDFTIADFVADVRAATPSAAAEITVPVKEDLLSRLTERRRQMMLALRQRVLVRQNQLRDFSSRIKDPRRRLPDLFLKVDGFRERFLYSFQVSQNRRRERLATFASNLSHLSPLSVLAKGYAVIQRMGDHHSIRRARELAPGDELKLLFHEGSAEAKVTTINSKS